MAYYNWVYLNIHQELPENAVKAGIDLDGCDIFVGRAFHRGQYCVAKIIPGKQEATLSYNMNEIRISEYDVLTGTDFEWKHSSNGDLPANAICTSQERKDVYVGRTLYNGELVPGKIETSHQCIYIPYRGSEIAFKQYEALVQPKNAI